MKTAAVLFGWAVIVLAAAFADDSYAASVTRISSNEVVFSGQIIPRDAVKVFNTVKDGDTLYVDSIGGNAQEGIFLHKALKLVDVKVVVEGVCASACATMALGAKEIKGSLKFHAAWSRFELDKYSQTALDNMNKRMAKIYSDHLTADQIEAILAAGPTEYVEVVYE